MEEIALKQMKIGAIKVAGRKLKSKGINKRSNKSERNKIVDPG